MGNIRYNREFKEQAVQLVLEAGRSVPEVAEDFGVHMNTLYKWIKQYEEHGEDAFPGSGKQLPEAEELKQLRKEVANLKMENDILKKATAIFAKGRK